MVTRTDSQTPGAPVAGLHALVLAAGAGTRMGGDKLRRTWRGKPLLSWALAAALRSPAQQVWLVTGSDPGLAALAPRDGRLSITPVADWEQGLAASLKGAIAALPPTARAALVFLGDMPRIPFGVAAALAQAWRDGARAAAPVWEGRRGHPVLLDRSLFDAIAGFEGDRGAGALLASLGEGVALVEAPDDGVLFDVDTADLLEP